MLFLSLVIVFVPAVLGGNICCTPRQWEGMEAQVIGTVTTGGKPELTEVETMIHFDATNKRIAYDEKVTINGYSARAKVIQLWDKMTEYIIRETGTCTRHDLNGSMPSACIPDTATTSGPHFEGSGTNKISFNSYRTVDNGVIVIADMTSDSCEPIRWVAYSVADPVLISNKFYDISYGIKNATVFDIPAACNNAPLTTLFLSQTSSTTSATASKTQQSSTSPPPATTPHSRTASVIMKKPFSDKE